MSIELGHVAIVSGVDVETLLVQVSASWHVTQLVLLRIECLLVIVARTSAEVGNLVHVHPQAIELDVLEEGVELVLEPRNGVLLEEVWEDTVTWPDDTNGGLVGIGCLDPDILLDTRLVDVVVVPLCETSVNDWHEVLVVAVKLRNEVR